MEAKKNCCESESVTRDSSTKCCSSNGALDGQCCCTEKPSPRHCLIEFLYIDLTVCERCLGTDVILDEAIMEVSNVLKATGYEIEVRKILVKSEEQALELGFVSSPTIRINGQDIQLDFKENLCESCGDVCGEEVDCRVWIWQGREYTTPPKAMIIDSILKHIYGGPQAPQIRAPKVPENLKKFFAAKAKR